MLPWEKNGPHLYLQIYYIYLFFCVCVCLSSCEYATYVHAKRPEEDFEFPVFPVSCELPNEGAENWTQFLWTSGKWS